MKKSSSDISAGNAAPHEVAPCVATAQSEGCAANRAAFPVAAGYQLTRSTSE